MAIYLDFLPGFLCIIYILLMFAAHVNSNGAPDGDAEYCELDVFKPSCGQNEMILMKSAFYGRMALGRCVTQDYGIGCKADVLPVMDGFCSGRQMCSVTVGTSAQFLAVKAKVCPRDGSAYLSADYECISVMAADGQQCQTRQYTSLASRSGYISSSSQSSSQSCPYRMTFAQGRRVNITMLSFPPPPSESTVSSSACYEVGSIRDGDKSKTIHKCLNDPRHKQLYLSNGGQVEIDIPHKESHDVAGHFLLQYEVIGCSDPAIPDKAILKRSGHRALVTCKNSDESWELICEDEKWQGNIGKCSQEVSGWTFLGLFDHEHPYGTAIVVGIGATLGVLTGGILLYIIIAIFKKCQKSDYVMTYEYTDPSFAHIPTDYHADKSNLLLQDDKLFEQNSNTWGSQRHGNSNTLSRGGGTDHSRVPLPPLPNDNNTLSYEKPLYNRNGNV